MEFPVVSEWGSPPATVCELVDIGWRSLLKEASSISGITHD